MTRPLDPPAAAALLDAADLVETLLKGVPACCGPDYIAARAAHLAAVDAVLAGIAQCHPDLRRRKDHTGWAVTLLGLRSSSTSGTAAALRNWITRARATATRIGEDADHA